MEQYPKYNNRYGLYVHVPFCKSKCSYCDFYRVVDLSSVAKYVDSVISEMHFYKNNLPQLTTVYIGGGTPSILGYSLLEKLLAAINSIFDLSKNEEFTVECNPEDVDENIVFVLKNNGVNRVSLGVQSLNDKMLRFLNRRHDSVRVYNVLELLQNNKISNVSVDLIFGYPKIDDYSFEDDLHKFVSLDVQHISAYSLSYEEGSWLTKLVDKGKITPLDDDEVANQYDVLTAAMTESNFNHYEISNYSKNSRYSRHNTDCWNRVPYIGVGPGAYSFDGVKRWNNSTDLKKYLDNPLSSRINIETLSSDDVFNEIVMLGLRTRLGIKYNDILSLDSHYHVLFLKNITELISEGMIEKKLVEGKVYYSIPEARWFLLDMITERVMV